MWENSNYYLFTEWYVWRVVSHCGAQFSVALKFRFIENPKWFYSQYSIYHGLSDFDYDGIEINPILTYRPIKCFLLLGASSEKPQSVREHHFVLINVHCYFHIKMQMGNMWLFSSYNWIYAIFSVIYAISVTYTHTHTPMYKERECMNRK